MKITLITMPNYSPEGSKKKKHSKQKKLILKQMSGAGYP